MKTRIIYLISLSILLLLIPSCGEKSLFNKENEKATIEILYPEQGKSYIKTSLDFPSYMVVKLTDPDKNGKFLRVSGNGTAEFALNEDPKYYDDEPDTIRFSSGLSELIYPDAETNLISLIIEVEDDAEENKFSSEELDFYLTPDEVSITNSALSKEVYMGEEYLKLDFDVSTLSGELGSVVSLNFTTSSNNPVQGTSNHFEVYNGYWSRVIDLNANGFELGTEGPFHKVDLTSHYSSLIYGPQIESGNSLYLFAYVFDPFEVNSTTSYIYKRLDLGIIP
ncbi:hypothetical protein JKA74_09855 [Marivirga sp. S37H4]|uniref:Uncharacterized protein n=1 Tax=Marivirga aurantiaca TaxID=2802615 RepID=A0A934WY74_9BACT|nr:hypothetical protein [Marivirga aurantiaca]MBK6265343.1 hypothetical protein [Marivirga aurantiaca]